MGKLRNVQDVADWGLCTGCGACAYICPENITLINIVNEGIRPSLQQKECEKCDECVKVCSGIKLEHSFEEERNIGLAGLAVSWGPILEIWEGYAADPEVRYHGSSGGLSSALALFCIEKGGMQGVLHIGQDDEFPLRNKTVFSTSRKEILGRTGSRYAPASPCDGLSMMAAAPGRSVFIGKPCDVASVRLAQSLRAELANKIGLTIGFFCAGTPSMEGTLELVKRLGIDPDAVDEIRYRGKGWPGKFSVRIKGEQQPREVMTYMDSWGFLQKYRPYRCHLCPDGTGEFADIACGDPWYRPIGDAEPGQSLVLVRTERGKEVVRGAIEAGYVIVKPGDESILGCSQPGLAGKRRAIWGRILAMKSFGIPTPNLKGFSLFENWKLLCFKEKVRSILGTARRIVGRGYYRRARRLSKNTTGFTHMPGTENTSI